MANVIADTCIVAVDEFLKTPPGARPSLGQRDPIANFFGLENATNAPWCADWAEGMFDAMREIEDQRANQAVRWSWAQWNREKHPIPGITDRQHNWVAMYPAGYSSVEALTGSALNNQPVLFFDPWGSLMPDVMTPANHNVPLTDWNVADTID